MYPACLIGSRAWALTRIRTHLYARRSWLRPIARCRDFTSDWIQAGQLKRVSYGGDFPAYTLTPWPAAICRAGPRHEAFG
jgi:hypothetical protein